MILSSTVIQFVILGSILNYYSITYIYIWVKYKAEVTLFKVHIDYYKVTSEWFLKCSKDASRVYYCLKGDISFKSVSMLLQVYSKFIPSFQLQRVSFKLYLLILWFVLLGPLYQIKQSRRFASPRSTLQ